MKLGGETQQHRPGTARWRGPEHTAALRGAVHTAGGAMHQMPGTGGPSGSIPGLWLPAALAGGLEALSKAAGFL